MNILILFDKEFDIDREAICKFLNTNTNYLKFKTGKDITFDADVLTRPSSFNCITWQLDVPPGDFQRIICFTEKPYDDNYFFYDYGILSIFSFFGWPQLTDLSFNNGIVYFVIYYLALIIDESGFNHHEATGCIYDFLWYKGGIDDGMRQCKICPTCLHRINNNLSSDAQVSLLDDLCKLMDLLSNSSKWNLDILFHQRVESRTIIKRNSKKQGEINIVIASPGDTQSERNYLLERLEVQFRRGNHESHCNKRLIVHGWEDLASQNGYPQNVINAKIIEKMDFVVAVFRHKLGTPIIDPDTHFQINESGTTEELLQALDNAKEERPLGMAYFYSKAPVVSLDSPEIDAIRLNWTRLEDFKKSIQHKMIYKPYTESSDLLQALILDLEKNIIDYFE